MRAPFRGSIATGGARVRAEFPHAPATADSPLIFAQTTRYQSFTSVPLPSIASESPCDTPPAVSRPELALLVLVLAVALALRWIGLGSTPPGFWLDEAIYALDGLDVLRKPGWPLFFTTEGHPREPLFMYILAPVFGLFGPTTVVARGTAGAIGVLTIAVTWLWAREVSGSPRRALLVALALAFLRWHLHFSRTCFRTILTPLFMALLFWTVWKAARTRRPGWMVAAGFVLGAGFTTYLSFRVAPFILIALGVQVWWLGRKRAGEGSPGPAGPPTTGDPTNPANPPRSSLGHRRSYVFFFLALALGLSPTVIDAVRHPEHLTGRAGEVSPFKEGVGPGLGLIARQAGDVALTFFVRGDHVGKHNIPGALPWAQLYVFGAPGFEEAEELYEAQRAARATGSPAPTLINRLTGAPVPDPHGHGTPVFDLLCAAVFGVGLLRLLWRAPRDPAASHILLWMAGIGATSVVSVGAPNYLRMLGMTPAVAYVLVEGAESIAGRLRALRTARAASLAAAFTVAFFGYFAASESYRYFVLWPRHPLVWTEFNTEFAELGRLVRTLPETDRVYVPDYIADHATFRWETVDRPGIVRLTTEFSRDAQGRPLPPMTIEGEAWVILPRGGYPPAKIDPTGLTTLSRREILLPTRQPWAELVRVRSPQHATTAERNRSPEGNPAP